MVGCGQAGKSGRPEICVVSPAAWLDMCSSAVMLSVRCLTRTWSVPMKGTSVCLALACILSVMPCRAASTTVYRCNTGGKLVYSSRPCGKHARRLKLDDAANSISMVTPKLPHESTGTKTGRSHESQRCPADRLSSTELRNLRVSHAIVVCESVDQVRASWGKPSSVKHTVSKDHVRERWIYKDRKGRPLRSVNLEDGKVVSFQK